MDSSAPPPRSSADPGASVFVWGVWGASLLLALWYVASCGPDVPLWDDYAVAPQLCDQAPVTLSWLWSQHSEHRIPLARLVLLGVFRADGADPRPVMILITALLAAASAALLGAAARAPEGRKYADAFLPLLMMHLGHHDNLLWAIQITYVVPTALLCLVLRLVATQDEQPSLIRCGLVAACLAVMPLCNAGGLILIPPLALWLLAMGVVEARSGRPGGRARGVLILAESAPALILAALYLRGYSAPRHHAAPAGVFAALRTALQFLATSLGRPGVWLWPWSGVFVGCLSAAAGAVLLGAWCSRPKERARVAGFLCVLGAVGALALATGWGRSGEDDLAGLQPRYTTLAAPALAVVYIVIAYYGPVVLRSLVPMVLFAVFSTLLWPNTQEAIEAGRNARERAAVFDRDVAAGMPPYRLVRRHVPFLHPSQRAMHGYLEMLRNAKIGKFGRIRRDPSFRERPVALSPADVRLGRWTDGELIATGVDPWVRFELPATERIAGVRIRYDHHNDDGSPSRFRLAWRSLGDLDFPADKQYGDWNLETGEDREVTVWIDDVVSQIRLQPDNRPCRFRIRELTLLRDD